MKYVFCILIHLLTALAVFGVTVERIPILPRQQGVFTRSVKVALNTTTGQSLLLWEKYPGTALRHSIWARLLLQDGKPTGAAFPLITGPNPQFPDVAYNPDLNQFILVYANDTTGKGRFEIFAVRLTPAGRRSGLPVRVSPPDDRTRDIVNQIPRVVYDAATEGYVLVWTRSAFGSATGVAEGVYAAVLNTNLTQRQAPILVMPVVKNGTSVRGPSVTDIAIHPPSQKLLIAGYTISTEPGFSWQYFAARVDKTLKKPAPVVANLKSGLSSSAAPYVDLIQLGGGQMAGLFVEGSGVKMRKLNALSAPIGPVSLFFSDPVRTAPLEFPSGVYSPSSNETVVLGVDDSSTQTGSLWMQLATATGAATGQAAQLQSSISIAQRPAIQALPSTASGRWYAAVYVDGAQLSSPPGPGESSAPVLLRINTAN